MQKKNDDKNHQKKSESIQKQAKHWQKMCVKYFMIFLIQKHDMNFEDESRKMKWQRSGNFGQDKANRKNNFSTFFFVFLNPLIMNLELLLTLLKDNDMINIYFLLVLLNDQK